jgi:hypothetical protein
MVDVSPQVSLSSKKFEKPILGQGKPESQESIKKAVTLSAFKDLIMLSVGTMGTEAAREELDKEETDANSFISKLGSFTGSSKDFETMVKAMLSNPDIINNPMIKSALLSVQKSFSKIDSDRASFGKRVAKAKKALAKLKKEYKHDEKDMKKASHWKWTGIGYIVYYEYKKSYEAEKKAYDKSKPNVDDMVKNGNESQLQAEVKASVAMANSVTTQFKIGADQDKQIFTDLNNNALQTVTLLTQTA